MTVRSAVFMMPSFALQVCFVMFWFFDAIGHFYRGKISNEPNSLKSRSLERCFFLQMIQLFQSCSAFNPLIEGYIFIAELVERLNLFRVESGHINFVGQSETSPLFVVLCPERFQYQSKIRAIRGLTDIRGVTQQQLLKEVFIVLIVETDQLQPCYDNRSSSICGAEAHHRHHHLPPWPDDLRTYTFNEPTAA